MAKRERSTEAVEGRNGCCGDDCCGSSAGCCGLPGPGSCAVEAVVSLDARGQMVLPKDVRERFGVKAEDKLAVVAWSQGGRPCCLTLLKVDELADAVRKTYGPILKDVVRG